LWYVVFICAFLMIAFLWMLHMELTSQILLGGITAFFLGIMIFLNCDDRPLKGAVTVSPDSFQPVCDLVMKWDDAKPRQTSSPPYALEGGEANFIRLKRRAATARAESSSRTGQP
jgi:hypothetical protein